MKTRRIWIVIVVILIVGVCSTTYTKRYVKERELDASMKVMTEAAMNAAEAEAADEPPADAPMPFAAAVPADAGSRRHAGEESSNGTASANASAEDTASQEEDAAAALSEPVVMGAQTAEDVSRADGEDAALSEEKTGTSAGTGTAAAPAQNAPAGAGPLAMSPLTESAEMETAAAAQSSVVIAGNGKDKVAVSYKTRLEELDTQIERNRAADAEKPVGNSVKARSENELKLWEAELDGIMKALETRLGSEDIEKLYAKQREWRRDRDAKALEASKKQNGSSLEEVEYTVSLTVSTRSRAYELVKEYEAVLEE